MMKYYQVNSNLKYLNLGCGYRFDSQWTNVNFVATGKGVIPCDLAKSIPFADNTFELVYHSHLLEHFTQATAKSFMQECVRVLCPGGILRVVVPDLEQIARCYLTFLEKAEDSPESAANYEWMKLELLDQMVRNSSGGEMAAYLAQDKIDNQEFVIERYGSEASSLMNVSQNDSPVKSLAKQIKQFGSTIPNFLPKPLAKFHKGLKVGYFRQSGEVHQWMYDRYSLSVLLKNCGLEQVVQRSASESYLKQWTDFNLDTEPNGKIYKPDSLFIEGVKPN